MAGVFAIDGARRLTSVRLAYSPHAKSKLREQNLKARGACFLTIGPRYIENVLIS
jgi:hypothetical protein